MFPDGPEVPIVGDIHLSTDGSSYIFGPNCQWELLSAGMRILGMVPTETKLPYGVAAGGIYITQDTHRAYLANGRGDWLPITINAPQGAQGFAGPMGPGGPMGPQGSTGPAGRPGPTGPLGQPAQVVGTVGGPDQTVLFPGVTPTDPDQIAGHIYLVGDYSNGVDPDLATAFPGGLPPVGHGVAYQNGVWLDLGPIVGPTGDTGPVPALDPIQPAPTDLAPGTPPTVAVSGTGTPTDPLQFHLGVAHGPTGPTGPRGDNLELEHAIQIPPNTPVAGLTPQAIESAINNANLQLPVAGQGPGEIDVGFISYTDPANGETYMILVTYNPHTANQPGTLIPADTVPGMPQTALPNGWSYAGMLKGVMGPTGPAPTFGNVVAVGTTGPAGPGSGTATATPGVPGSFDLSLTVPRTEQWFGISVDDNPPGTAPRLDPPQLGGGAGPSADEQAAIDALNPSAQPGDWVINVANGNVFEISGP